MAISSSSPNQSTQRPTRKGAPTMKTHTAATSQNLESGKPFCPKPSSITSHILTMDDSPEATIRNLKAQYGANSPAVAEQLNLIGAELQARGHCHTALKLHQEALAILEFNKCNAYLYDFADKAKEYAMEMATTLRKIGTLLREMNNFVGAAEVYKESLDTFLEALVKGGGGLKRRLLECEYKNDASSKAVLARVDRKTIGRILSLDRNFRETVREIAELVSEMECVKFVGQNAASSRRRRRMLQHKAMEENLKNAVESLSLSTEETPQSSGKEEMGRLPSQPRQRLARSKSWTSATSDTDTWLKCFWEKERGRFSRPRPLSRRAITSDEEYDHYKILASMIMPAEESLVIALRRFPLPSSVIGDNKYFKSISMESEERASPPTSGPRGPPTAEDNLSPRSVARPVYQAENFTAVRSF